MEWLALLVSLLKIFINDTIYWASICHVLLKHYSVNLSNSSSEYRITYSRLLFFCWEWGLERLSAFPSGVSQLVAKLGWESTSNWLSFFIYHPPTAPQYLFSPGNPVPGGQGQNIRNTAQFTESAPSPGLSVTGSSLPYSVISFLIYWLFNDQHFWSKGDECARVPAVMEYGVSWDKKGDKGINIWNASSDWGRGR